MAGKHIKDLIAAYRDRDDLSFRRAADAIIEEEEAKRHTTLARDLRKLLATSGTSVPVSLDVLPASPTDRANDIPLADVISPNLLGLGDLVLPKQLEARLRELVSEVPHWPDLDAAGIPRRNRILLYGPPGNGKSSIAAALAAELRLPLAITRVDSLVSSYLGESAANLRTLFEFAATTPSVVLLDEFDSIGKLRDDPSDHGELRRVVNATLQMIDNYQGKSILVATTNSPEVLDTALWRRFDEVLEVPLPERQDTLRLLRALLGRRIEAPIVADASMLLAGYPFAAVEHAALGARRRAILDGRVTPTASDVSNSVNETISRPWA